MCNLYLFSSDNASILTRASAATIGEKGADTLFGSGGDYLDLPEMKEEKSVLLATGSADPYAYIYNVGEVNNNLYTLERRKKRKRGETDPLLFFLGKCRTDATS